MDGAMTGSQLPDELHRATWQKLIADPLIMCGSSAVAFLLVIVVLNFLR